MSWWSTDNDDADESEYDDYEIKARPNPKANRPRTKTRPEHANAVPGRIVTVDRGRFSVLVDESLPTERTIAASRARELGKFRIVTGDGVDLVGDVSGDDGTLCRVVRVHERSSLLRRSADDTDAVERVIVANADQMLLVVAAANPEPRARLIDRYLVAAFDAGITPILCITKTDLADPTAFLREFDCLDVPIITSTQDHFPLEELGKLLVGHTTVAVGHSGVGKSTLVNALVPGTERATGHVNEVTGRGRHTSSSTLALRYTDAQGERGWIIDTPGVRSFGLGHVDPANVIRSFARLARPSENLAAHEVPLTAAHDWEVVERCQAGELGESGKERIASLLKISGTLESRDQNNR